MARIGMVIVVGAIIISIVIALFAYVQYQPNYVETKAGEPTVVGPVEYTITFEGTHNGNEKTRPEHTFVKIRLVAKDISQENTRISGGQFFIVEPNGEKHQPVYGGFSEEDLLDDILEPNKPVSWTTQFDIDFDEKEKYNIIIRPTKEQKTVDTGVVCLINCQS